MKSHSILIVEDERIVARDIQMTLATWGYHVVAIATTGPQAISLALEHHPDLILMDIHLRGSIDGLQTAEAIQAHYPVRVVFLTANTDPLIQQRVFQNKPYGYLVKPFDQPTLQATLQMALEQLGSSDRQIEYKIASSKQSPHTSDQKGLNSFDPDENDQATSKQPVSISSCPVLVVEDDSSIREMLIAGLEDAGFAAVGAADGLDAWQQLVRGLRPCLILLDLMMPQMDGWHFRAMQQASSNVAHIPVVIITASRDPADTAACLGVQHWLSKPFNLEHVIEIVEYYYAQPQLIITQGSFMY